MSAWNPRREADLDVRLGDQLRTHHADAAAVKDELFLTTFYDGAVLLKMSTDGSSVSEVWEGKGKNEKKTDAIQSIMPTPWFDGDLVLGVDSYGEQPARLDARTGDRLWMTYAATGGQSDRWANAFLVRQGDRFFIPNEKGDLIIARLDREDITNSAGRTYRAHGCRTAAKSRLGRTQPLRTSRSS